MPYDRMITVYQKFLDSFWEWYVPLADPDQYAQSDLDLHWS